MHCKSVYGPTGEPIWKPIDRRCEQILALRDEEEAALRAELRRKKSSSRNRSHNKAAQWQREPAAYETQGQTHLALVRPKTARRRPRDCLPQIGDRHIEDLRSCLCQLYCADYMAWNWPEQYIHINRSLLHLLYVDKRYRQAQEAIRSLNPYSVPRILIEEIKSIWDHSSYWLKTGGPANSLSSVKKYRTRRLYPCPLNKFFGETRYAFPESSRRYLEDEYTRNPRPTTEEKRRMSEETGLTYERVTNFFKNSRQRRRRQDSISTTVADIQGESNVGLKLEPDDYFGHTLVQPTLTQFNSGERYDQFDCHYSLSNPSSDYYGTYHDIQHELYHESPFIRSW